MGKIFRTIFTCDSLENILTLLFKKYGSKTFFSPPPLLANLFGEKIGPHVKFRQGGGPQEVPLRHWLLSKGWS
jgi:hypothetical protein